MSEFSDLFCEEKYGYLYCNRCHCVHKRSTPHDAEAKYFPVYYKCNNNMWFYYYNMECFVNNGDSNAN